MNRAALRDLEEPVALLLTQVAGELKRPLNAVDVAVLRLAFRAIRGVHPRMTGRKEPSNTAQLAAQLHYAVLAMGDIDELMKAYAATTFTARTSMGEIRIRVGEINPELDALLDEHHVASWAYVTAYNPGSVRQASEENERRQQGLQAEVVARRVEFFEGEGVPDDASWLPERSVLILGIDESEAIELGARWGQVAIVAGVRGRPPRLVVARA